ncbi:MAG TPA: alpha/beta fold hydrolase [Dehalococcoidia bacterium]
MYWFLGIGLGIAVPAVLVCAALAAIAWKAYKVVVHPAHGFFDAPRMGDALEREEIRFLSRDGTQLAAWFIAGSRRQTVLLLHGYTACKDDMLSHAAFLHDAGFSLLLLDLRYCGDSAGVACTLGANERDDVQAAIEYLQLRDDVDHDGIGILGLSLGASLAILAACDSPSVRAVVAESAFRSLKSAVQQNFRRFTHMPSFPAANLTTKLTEWRHKVSALRVVPEREVGGLRRCALLLIHAQDDEIISVADSQAIFVRANEPKEFWLVPSAPHAMAFNVLRHEYVGRVVAFFDRWLPST